MEKNLKVESFVDFNLSAEVAQAIDGLGFKEPTPVQIRTFKKVMAGDDVIAMAQTGTGKTAAFGIPMAEKLDPKKAKVQALVLAPTRELALQVCRELKEIGKIRGIRSAAVYGGASFTKQVLEVKDGAQIVAGTPGRVLDHIRRGTVSFSQLKILVLDEADEMLSMGFEKEISQIIESLPESRQTLLFSATIPGDIQRLTKRYMGDATVISVSGDEVVAKELSHFVYLVSGQGRPRDMEKVIEAERPSSAIIFCNTRDETQTLAKYLQKVGYVADWLNSDLSQTDRERVMSRTRRGEIKFLVATDVAARGIDVSHLSHVMNYSFPESLEVYIHRTGRAGRMGRRGVAVSLIAPHDIGNLYYLRLTYKIFPVEKVLPDDKSEARTVELDRLDALRRKYKVKLNGGFLALARRLIHDVHGERIIAGLLANHFLANGEGVVSVARQSSEASREEDLAADDKDEPVQKTQSLKEDTSKNEGRDTKETGQDTEAKIKRVSPEKSKNQEDADSSEAAEEEIFINAGRKDGLRIAHLMKEILRLTEIDRSALGKVRMLTRSTFISVPLEHFQSVLKVLGQIEVAGRKLKAEPAKKS